MSRAVIVGTDHNNTLGIVRSLGEIGILVSVVLFGNEPSFTSKSKYISDMCYCKDDARELANLLIKNYSGLNEDIIVIPSCDKAAELLDRQYDLLKGCFKLGSVNGTQGQLIKLMDKGFASNMAKKAGLNVPKSFEIHISKSLKADDIELAIEENELIFPIIIKPIESFNGRKTQIMVLYDKKDLSRVLNILNDGRYLVQKYLNIKMEYGVQGVTLYDGSDVIVPGVIRKIRRSMVATGSTTYAQLIDYCNKIDVNAIKRFVSTVGYRGIFDIEFIDDGEKTYFIEINCRNGAYGYAYTCGGVNFPFIWCTSCTGGISPIHKKVETLTFMSEFADFRSVKERRVSLYEWIKQFISADVKLTLNKKDLKPFLWKIMLH